MVLVGSALVARRSHFSAGGRWMAPVWIAIFAALVFIGRWMDGN